MKPALIFLQIFFISNSLAEESRTYFLNKKSYSLAYQHRVWVSEHCLKECLALKAPTITVKKPSFSSQPASDFCHKAGGKYLVVQDKLGLSEGICEFSDGSYILAWDYFKKFKTK